MTSRTIAGRYRVEREVGRGGMGSVWLCRDERLGRDVAIKEVGPRPGETIPHLARAMREARSSAALNHPHVVAVYDAVEEDGHVWLVMEYIPGRTLSQIVAEEGPIAPERAAWIGAQVADGLTSAHDRGTVHRDVKPGNILVSVEDRAKISDFGIARTLGEEKLTQSGLMSGTPAYLSPELARGEDPSLASDVWALGASLYAAVEGHAPYPDDPNLIAVLNTIATQHPTPPAQAGVLEEPIGKMMDPDPTARWTMRECAHVLRRIGGPPGPEGTRQQAAVASLVASSEPTPVPSPMPEPAQSTPEPPPARSRPHRRVGRVLLLLGGLAALIAVVATGILLLDLGGDDNPGAEPSESAGQTPDRQDTDPTRTPDATTPPPQDPTTSASDPSPANAGAATGFVADYYSVVPEDTNTGWSLLTPEFQAEIGRDSNNGFWATIDSVTVDDVESAGRNQVLTTLTFASDGSTEQEVHRISLERAGDSFLVADDELVG